MGVTLYSRIPAIVAAMPAKAGAVVQKTAADIEATAKSLAPVDTGALRASIAHQMTGQTSAVVQTGIEYSIYQEYGTRYMAAQPYMTPAAERHRGPFVAAMRSIVQ